jgi:hypothetical protein
MYATAPRGHHNAVSPFLSKRALQVYLFLFVNTLIFVVRSQWM